MASKILIIINSLSTGGAERQVVTDANMLSRNGHEVTIAFQKDGFLRKALANEVETYRIKYKNEIAAMLQLILYLKKNRFNVIFGHMFWAHKVTALPSWLTRQKYVFFEHGLGLGRKWYHLLLLRILDNFASKVVTVSAAKKRIKISREKTPTQKIVIIHNCVNQESKPLGKENNSIPGQNRTELSKIIFMGRFNKVKQLGLTVAIAKLIVKKSNDFIFILCGDGPEFEAITLLIKESNLEKYFQLPGFVANPHDILSKGDVFILPSRMEDFSVALLEAGYAGLPLVAFDVGGNREIIVDGETGYIIKPFDIVCLAEKLLGLINDRELCKKMGNRAKEMALGNYTEDVRYNNLLTLINSL